MRIAIAYPPIETDKGVPLLSQNRQFQYFHNPTFIFPCVPAMAASLLQKHGYDVVWLDGIAERKSYAEWLKDVERADPHLMAIETKTPTVKQYWRVIDDLKQRFPRMTIVLMGDHVTALPEESLLACKVDYVLTGGDFDFSLLNLANHLTRGSDLEPGFYFWDGDTIRSTGHFIQHNPRELPLIDRELVKWKLYAYHNGNFKYTPGTYTMVGRDCWWRKGGGCTFCSWTSTFPKFRVDTPEKLLDEVGHLIDLGVREIFDDTGTFPVGPWLEKFCKGMIERGYHKHVKFGCNMRADALTQREYELMGKAGFRFILYGLESASQRTLDLLNKGTKWDDIVTATKWAREAGLDPHVTCMVGYPWETYEEAKKTIELTRMLFDKGYVETLQATIVIPYPGTELFRQCEQNGWLKFRDWERYDMREPVMVSPIPDEKIMELVQSLYTSFLTPRYIVRKLTQIRTMDDVNYYIVRGSKYLWGHLKDFAKEQVARRRAGTVGSTAE
jgi:anaerobic magnesium-protoporphyrin IX monomethyl ester cyclase